MRRRRALVRLAGARALAAAALGARAQRERPARVALLMLRLAGLRTARSPTRSRVALRDLGWVEGRDVAFAFQWADGYTDRLPRLAAHLARETAGRRRDGDRGGDPGRDGGCARRRRS